MKLFRRILVPHDFSTHATRALEVATSLARQHGGRLFVLHAITPFHPISALPEEAVSVAYDATLVGGELQRLKELVARTVRGRNAPRVECKVVIGDAFRRIMAAARDVDSVVMATAGHTGLAHLLIGSVAEKVVRHAPVPVLTVRAKVARRKAGPGRRARGGGKRRRAARRR
jgi:nucleotide-binding universal stress UspA family protein